jgi:hypothetical protein
MSLSILESGTSGSADGLGVDFYSDLATDSSPNPHYQPLFDVLLVLGPSFMLPVENNLCSHRRSICFGGAEIRHALGCIYFWFV